jgi:hypothetical protein
LRYQHDTSLYPPSRLIAWDWIYPYKLWALFIYSPSVCL